MITKIKTNSREEWLELRKKYIGGSDAAAVVGLNQYVSPYALWAEKSGMVEGFSGNLSTEVGTYLEEFVAQLFERKTGKKIHRENRSFLNSDYPFAIANIDRKISGEDAGLEIKTCSELRMKAFANGEYPSNYYVQCMHYMAVTGLKKWYLAVLVGNHEFLIFEIERDEDEIEALMCAEKLFWDKVCNHIPPEMDGSQSTTDAISAIYPNENDETADLSIFGDDLAMRANLKASVKALEEQIGEIENRLKAAMGNCGSGVCGRWKVSWKTQTRQTVNKKKLMAELGEGAAAFLEESESRVMRITEGKK